MAIKGEKGRREVRESGRRSQFGWGLQHTGRAQEHPPASNRASVAGDQQRKVEEHRDRSLDHLPSTVGRPLSWDAQGASRLEPR